MQEHELEHQVHERIDKRAGGCHVGPMTRTASANFVEELALGDMIFWVNKVLLFSCDQMIEQPAQMTLRASKLSGPTNQTSYGFGVQYRNRHGIPVSLSHIACDDNIVQVCYQMMHMPSGLISPIYDHEYTKVAPHTRGIPTDLGKVKLFPVAKVWPELAKGYSGSLPQLIQ